MRPKKVHYEKVVITNKESIKEKGKIIAMSGRYDTGKRLATFNN